MFKGQLFILENLVIRLSSEAFHGIKVVGFLAT